ncbi:MAG: polyketide synthase, partial [Acidobacteria bacterium]|nr:polyketide synthase [Acidobacteriota bacterium]
MSGSSERIARLSPARLALLALELQEKVDRFEARRHEPIAVIGMGCRFPGAGDPDAFWQLLHDGVDAIAEIPPARWSADAFYDPNPEAPGKMATRWAGLLPEIDRFDASFFGISPREAVSLDPQQRLLLEVAWEAFEDAGCAPDQLDQSATGVFVGVGTSDYAHLLTRGSDLNAIDGYRATGCVSHSPASGRIAYVLGLRGPAISIDTACSSSLVAVHLACQSLRSEECRMAIAGGVNAILLPELTISLSKSGMMAGNGRCKTFDAAADGFVRGEGCGLIVLKRLADALEDGDRLLGVIRGSAVNQDGRSHGLTAPNGPAQEAVIRAALDRAGIAPERVTCVETHGTGTPLGDPIEVQALGDVLCPGGSNGRRVHIGSVKTNIGHLEAAAGVAGLIKLLLALQHRTIPPHLHFSKPNPHIPWDRYAFDVPTTATPWASDGSRVGAVSSFGFSGTNAHVVVEEAPAVAAGGAAERSRAVLTLSAKSGEALATLAG